MDTHALMSGDMIKEHMEVIGADGKHVGTVDKVEGARLKLTRNDPAAGDQHHYLPLDAVATIEQNRVCLTMDADEAKRVWQSAG